MSAIETKLNLSVKCDCCGEDIILIEDQTPKFPFILKEGQLKELLKAQGVKLDYDSEVYQSIFGIFCKVCQDQEKLEG